MRGGDHEYAVSAAGQLLGDAGDVGVDLVGGLPGKRGDLGDGQTLRLGHSRHSKAGAAGFDFSVISDHYQPWLDEQGHSGYAWSILGAAAQATSTIGLMTYVT